MSERKFTEKDSKRRKDPYFLRKLLQMSDARGRMNGHPETCSVHEIASSLDHRPAFQLQDPITASKCLLIEAHKCC